MIETIQKIFKNDIMYYVIVPFAIIVLGWVKNGHDIREKNKELGYWMIKFKKVKLFEDIAMTMYKKLAAVLFATIIIREIATVYFGNFTSYIISSISYFIFGAFIVFFTYKEPKTKAEFLTKGRYKK